MPKIEIDENEYAELKRVAGVAELIGKNPEARQRLQEAVAIAAPDQVGPEIRIRKEVNERLSGIEKLLADDKAERQKEREEREATDAKRRLESQWLEGRRLARESGYTDEGLEKLETYMEKEGVASHRIAMAAYERENPPPDPVVTGGSRWNFFDQASDGSDAALKAFMDSGGQADEQFLGALVPKAISEVRGR